MQKTRGVSAAEQQVRQPSSHRNTKHKGPHATRAVNPSPGYKPTAKRPWALIQEFSIGVVAKNTMGRLIRVSLLTPVPTACKLPDLVCFQPLAMLRPHHAKFIAA